MRLNKEITRKSSLKRKVWVSLFKKKMAIQPDLNGQMINLLSDKTYTKFSVLPNSID
jgi:hypothetical protein